MRETIRNEKGGLSHLSRLQAREGTEKKKKETNGGDVRQQLIVENEEEKRGGEECTGGST